jgi:hypothetical protein
MCYEVYCWKERRPSMRASPTNRNMDADRDESRVYVVTGNTSIPKYGLLELFHVEQCTPSQINTT